MNIINYRIGLIAIGSITLLTGSHAIAMKQPRQMTVMCKKIQKKMGCFNAKTTVNEKMYSVMKTYGYLYSIYNNTTLPAIRISENREIPLCIQAKLRDALKRYTKFVSQEWEGSTTYTEPPPIFYSYNL